MAVKFLEPGGDADFGVNTTTNNGFWNNITGTPVIATDFVNGAHIKSIKYPANGSHYVLGPTTLSATGARISFYIYLVALPSATAGIMNIQGTGIGVFIRLTTGGVLQLWNSTTGQIGSNGSTLSTGVWYRISLAYTFTSTTVNEFRLFKNGTLDISVTNATMTGTTVAYQHVRIGNREGNSTLDFRSSDHYIDDSSSLTDTGNIWVTAKRPNANGTTNQFTTQIGSGGSGYGSGHSPQVNERALNTANGWSVINAGSVQTEEYNIENISTGDINLTGATIIDYIGWVSASSVTSETASILINNVTSNIALTSSATLFYAVAGSSTYPAGTGTDIGIVTSNTVTTVGLYEAGIIFAFIPPSGVEVLQSSIQPRYPVPITYSDFIKRFEGTNPPPGQLVFGIPPDVRTRDSYVMT